jgi:hypothetical protein
VCNQIRDELKDWPKSEVEYLESRYDTVAAFMGAVRAEIGRLDGSALDQADKQARQRLEEWLTDVTARDRFYADSGGLLGGVRKEAKRLLQEEKAKGTWPEKPIDLPPRSGRRGERERRAPISAKDWAKDWGYEAPNEEG